MVSSGVGRVNIPQMTVIWRTLLLLSRRLFALVSLAVALCRLLLLLSESAVELNGKIIEILICFSDLVTRRCQKSYKRTTLFYDVIKFHSKLNGT